MGTDNLKRAAAQRAAEAVRAGQTLGLGTGSTVRFFLEALAARRLKGVRGVPTSEATAARARELGLALTTLDEHPRLDLAVDGADEVDPELNLIKGLGGALLREKVVAAASERFVVIADEGKLVERLGQRGPLPVEVLPFALRPATEALRALGGQPELRRRGGAPFRTDQDNVVLDVFFGEIAHPSSLAVQLQAVPGVLAHGLFLGLADEAIVAGAGSVRVLTR